MGRVFVLFGCLILVNSLNVFAQRTISGISDKGLLHPEESAPRLEARVTSMHNNTNTLTR